MKNKKNIIFIVAVLLALVIGYFINEIFFVNENNVIEKKVEKKLDKKEDNNIIVRENGIREFKKGNINVVKMNHIIRYATKESDLQYCEKLKYDTLKKVCISRIKFKLKFPQNLTSDTQCNQKNEHEKNVCLYNFYIRSIRDDSYKEKCSNITNSQISRMCITKIKLKLSK